MPCMRLRDILPFIALTILVLPRAARAQGDSLITRITGSVQVMRAQSQEWTRAKLNQPVTIGDAVRTLDDSVCEIKLVGGATVNLEENTEFAIPKDATNTKTQIGKVEVPAGGIWATFKKLFQGQSFEVDTKNAVGGVHGTVFNTDVNVITGSADWALLEGQIALTPARTGAKTLNLVPGLRATVAKDMLVHKVKRFDVLAARTELKKLQQGISIKRPYRAKLPARGRVATVFGGVHGPGAGSPARPGKPAIAPASGTHPGVGPFRRRPLGTGRFPRRPSPVAPNRPRSGLLGSH